MDDLISRAAALDAIDGMKPMQGSMEQLAMKALCWAAVKTIQPVNAAPVVHGRWIHCDGKSHIWYCSNCGEKVNYNNAHKVYAKSTRPIEEVNRFCRNCGAKMDGERRDEGAVD